MCRNVNAKTKGLLKAKREKAAGSGLEDFASPIRSAEFSNQVAVSESRLSFACESSWGALINFGKQKKHLH